VGRAALARWINAALDGWLRPVVFRAPDDGELQLGLQPTDLLAAWWFPFARAVLEHKQYRACQVCESPFEVSPETARTNRRSARSRARTGCSGIARLKARFNAPIARFALVGL
jgi:hypothetical protein